MPRKLLFTVGAHEGLKSGSETGRIGVVVGIYGMVLAPVGAIIMVDVYFSKRLGILSDPAAATDSTFNVAALLAWIVPALIGFWAVGYFDMPLPTYATLPVWLDSGLLYIVLAKPLGPEVARVASR